MKHIKLIEPGYESFSGFFGTVEFDNGTSVKPVTSVETLRLQAILRAEEIGDEVDESVDMKVTFDTVAAPAAAQPTDDEEGAEYGIFDDGKVWSREELEAVADKGGIKAVREIAGPLGVTGKSIAELIDGILAKG